MSKKIKKKTGEWDYYQAIGQLILMNGQIYLTTKMNGQVLLLSDDENGDNC